MPPAQRPEEGTWQAGCAHPEGSPCWHLVSGARGALSILYSDRPAREGCAARDAPRSKHWALSPFFSIPVLTRVAPGEATEK